MLVREGGVEIEVPGTAAEGVGDDVFYNPKQELNRDLTIAVLRAFREDRERAETYLDAMAASGIRGVRAAADGWDATLCDYDERAVELCRNNIARNDLTGEVVRRDTNAFMHESFFDVIDLDPYGTPIPFVDAAFANVRHLVCVTATDTAPLCGAHLQSGIRKYGAIPHTTDYHAEVGLRVLVSALARTAARYDVGVTPVFCHATRHYVRTYLACSSRATDANAALENLGYVYHCEDCLHREAEYGLLSRAHDSCPACESNRTATIGPIWLARTSDPTFARRVGEHVDDGMGTAKRSRKLAESVSDELDAPTHYDQHRLCKEWNRPAGSMDEFLGALRDVGFEASRTHYGGTTLKTTATVSEIRDATRFERE